MSTSLNKRGWSPVSPTLFPLPVQDLWQTSINCLESQILRLAFLSLPLMPILITSLTGMPSILGMTRFHIAYTVQMLQ